MEAVNKDLIVKFGTKGFCVCLCVIDSFIHTPRSMYIIWQKFILKDEILEESAIWKLLLFLVLGENPLTLNGSEQGCTATTLHEMVTCFVPCLLFDVLLSLNFPRGEHFLLSPLVSRYLSYSQSFHCFVSVTNHPNLKHLHQHASVFWLQNF